MFNKCIMMGRIVNDIEFKTTPTGVNVAQFRIAVDRRFQQKGEERKSDFFNIVVWRQQADFVNRYFSKGRMIMIEGELNTRQYTDKNGNPSTWYEIVADRVSFTGEKAQGGSYGDSYGAPAPSVPPQYAAAPASAPAAAPASDFSAAESDDDYPF
ncbi:MAG: single-stranded DNA-binding protein [Ruminococcaceae bacterium]|nr:single-stranded DNA-binding protein [Oscillospiraceae bacterium]